MFCRKCGTQNPDHAAYCKNCGAPLSGQKKTPSPASPKPPVQRQPQPQQHPAPKKKRPLNKKIIVAVIAVAIFVLGFFLFGGRSYKATVKQYVNAQFEIDIAKVFKLVPKGVLEYAMEEEGVEDLDELLEEASDAAQDQIDYIERYLGEDWEISYEIVSAEKMSKKELEQLKKTYKKFDVKVSAARDVELELTIKAGETERSTSMDFSVIKVGRSWYLDVDSLGDLL